MTDLQAMRLFWDDEDQGWYLIDDDGDSHGPFDDLDEAREYAAGNELVIVDAPAD